MWVVVDAMMLDVSVLTVVEYEYVETTDTHRIIPTYLHFVVKYVEYEYVETTDTHTYL